MAARSKTRHIGSDVVVLEGDRLLVTSGVKMDGWDVRKHRAAMIRFNGRTWRITRKTVGADRTIQYELLPWQPGEQDIPGHEIDYTPDYVALRDHTAAIGRRRNRGTVALRIASPFVGFLPARIKGRLEQTHGLDPVTSTFQSIFFEFLIALGSLVLIAIGKMVLGVGGVSAGFPTAFLWMLGIAVAVDGAVRYSRILSEERPPPGFYEWLLRRRVK